MIYLIVVILVGILILSIVALVSQLKDKDNNEKPSKQIEGEKKIEPIKDIDKKTNQLNSNTNQNSNRFSYWIIMCFMLSGASIIFALFQLYADDNELNIYVGGDAYNYIISSNHATGYFILGFIFAMSSFSMMIINEIRDIKDSISNRE